MKNLKFDDQFPNPSPEILNSIELKFGLVLPEEYRTFLLTQGGGQPSESNEVFSPDESDLPVQVFFGFGGKYGSLFEALEVYQEREWATGEVDEETVHKLPIEFMPFADTVFGDFFCVGVRPPVQGQVFFWSHDQAPVEGIEMDHRFEDFYFLTNTFGDFIECLG